MDFFYSFLLVAKEKRLALVFVASPACSRFLSVTQWLLCFWSVSSGGLKSFHTQWPVLCYWSRKSLNRQPRLCGCKTVALCFQKCSMDKIFVVFCMTANVSFRNKVVSSLFTVDLPFLLFICLHETTFWPLGGSGTRCEHNIDITDPYKVAMANVLAHNFLLDVATLDII